jgi:outer membrane cobalamin receptor
LVTTPWVTVGYTLTLVGVRYSREQNIASTWMEPYADHGITLSRDFDLGKATLRLKAQVLNLLDTQYEVVQSYPMMGRNYRIGITIET